MLSQDYTCFIALGEVDHGCELPFPSYHIGESGTNISNDVEIDLFVKVVFISFLH